ncbi:MAG: methyltransferase domain-containing protein [Fuerstiella sp.]
MKFLPQRIDGFPCNFVEQSVAKEVRLLTFSNRWNAVVFSLWAPVYDALLKYHPVTAVRRKALSIAASANARRVLLVGVGTGADLPILATMQTELDVLVGIDLSTTMLSRSNRKATSLSLPFVSVCGDAQRLPLANQAFDLVVLTLIVSVVPNPRTCVAEAMRVLQPGGRLVVLDKFLHGGHRPSVGRRILNFLTRPFGTDINRRWEDMGPEDAECQVDEASGPANSIRLIILRKPIAASET